MTNAGIQPLPTEPKHKGLLYRLLRAITPLRAAVHFARKRLSRYRPQVWRLEGRERVSGAPLVIVYAGQIENKNYIAELAFGRTRTEVSLGRKWVCNLMRWAAA
jgi:hypothetical protein